MLDGLRVNNISYVAPELKLYIYIHIYIYVIYVYLYIDHRFKKNQQYPIIQYKTEFL